MNTVLEPYLRDDVRWGNWHLSRAGSALYNVRHANYEFAFKDVRDVEALATRVRHTVMKSWCIGAESADLCRAIESVTGLGVYIRRERNGRGPVRASALFQRVLNEAEHVKVLVRDNGGEALNRGLYLRLRQTFPR